MFDALAKLQTGGHQPNASFHKHFFKGVFYSEELCPMVHANIISHVNVHPCAKFYVIRTMLGESMVMHDHRPTSYLNFESGRIGRERLFLRVYYF